MAINFIYPEVRINPEYRFNEIMSGYNYNFTLLENFNELTGITVVGNLIVTGNTILNTVAASSMSALTFSAGTIYSGDTDLSFLFFVW